MYIGVLYMYVRGFLLYNSENFHTAQELGFISFAKKQSKLSSILLEF